MSRQGVVGLLTKPLCGSYAARDCLFLLKPVQAEFKSIVEKERMIQQGRLHYSETIHRESAPTEAYRELFFQLLSKYKCRLASEIMALARAIAERRDGPIVLLSLARAGTPVGVLLNRALNGFFHRESCHFSLSIIRDRGIDENALDWLIDSGRRPDSFVFVDGWTAKGVITRELKASIAKYNFSRGVSIPAELFVVSDIGGTADVAATHDDYAIPSALMNSTVSGLVSRSILNSQIGERDFHGCILYDHLRGDDLSVWFVDQVTACMSLDSVVRLPEQSVDARQKTTRLYLNRIMDESHVSDVNRIKPGVAEATRVMLRRVPDLLMVRQAGHTDVVHLLRLAAEKSVPVQEREDMPFGACALIRDVLKESS